MISRDCENLARRVTVPAPGLGGDPYVYSARTLQALGTANGRLSATRECQARQRVRLSR